MCWWLPCSLAERPHWTDQLVVCDFGSISVVHEPPWGGAHGGQTHVDPDDHVAEEQPATNERVLGSARGLLHDVHIRGVEAERRRRKAVCD